MAVNYSLYQPEIFRLFKTGYIGLVGHNLSAEKFFATAIAAACRDIAAAFDCSLLLSAQRLEETRQCWLHEAERIVTRKSTEPDHLKLCGFLAFWMHRRIVVDATQPESAVRSPGQTGFMRFGNEICAFMALIRAYVIISFHAF